MCAVGPVAKNHSWHHLPGSERRNYVEVAPRLLLRGGLQYVRGFSAGVEMQSKRVWIMGWFLFAAALLVVMLPCGARLNAKQAAAQSEEPVPAYHAQPPTQTIP